jgi:hypothetical protein
MASIISLATSSVALAQMSTTLLYFSPWVIKAFGVLPADLDDLVFGDLRIVPFFSGMIMASMEMESPPLVEYL